MTPTLHLIEPGGRGGVYQHAATLGAALSGAEVPVILHTAADAENIPGVTVVRHACFWRQLRFPRGVVRRVAMALGWLAVGVPGIVRRLRPGDVVQIEGRLLRGLMVPVVLGAGLRRCTVVYSPHNTFPRQGGSLGERAVVRWLARHSDLVLAFTQHDCRLILGWGTRAVLVPLLAPPMTPDPQLVAGWRRRWRADGDRRVVLLAGQLRADKGVDVAVRAAARWRKDLVLAVVGEDVGALSATRRLAAALGVHLEVDEGFQPLDRFVAAVAAADVVICPYRVASQSAVLAMAARFGRPSVASDVGALAEMATVTGRPGDPGALAAGVERALAIGAQPVAPPASAEMIRPYLDAYARWRVEPAMP